MQQVHAELSAAGVGFASIDTVAGYVMEVNVANPGGLATLAEVYGEAEADRTSQRLLDGAAARLPAA